MTFRHRRCLPSCGAGNDDAADPGAGPRRRRRGLPRAHPSVPDRAQAALLPASRLGPGRRRHAAGDPAVRLARAQAVRRPRVVADLAVPDRHQPLPERAARERTPAEAGAAGTAVRADRSDSPRRAGLAGALPGRSARRPARHGRGSGGAVRDQGDDRARVRRRRPAPAAAAVGRAAAPRRARLPLGRGRDRARQQRGLGQQRTPASPGHDDRSAAGPGSRTRPAAAVGPGTRAGRTLRGGVFRGRYRRRGRVAHRRRLVHHAAGHPRVPGRRGDRRLHAGQRALPGRQARPAGPGTGQRTARVRLLCAGPARADQPRARDHRADHGGRPDLRHHPVH